MKKIFLSLTFIILTISMVIANPIDASTAKNLAHTFWNLKFNTRGNADFKNVSAEAGVQNFYIFNNESAPGFVIIAGDDCAIPVLGYSADNNFATDNMPANLRSWLQHYDRTIGNAVANNAVATAEIAQQWANLQAGQLPVAGTRDAVAALLSSQWDQDSPYNDLCPGTSSERSYTGCAATAMAQVMKYHAWPTTGTGSHSYTCNNSGYNYGTLSANFGNTTYQWSSMLNTYPYSTSGTSAQRTAVATLMYHCGVAIEMAYTPEGSGAYIADFYYYTGSHASVEYALKTYFSYKTSLHSEWEEDYTTTQWKNLLKSDLNNSLPIVYSGYDENYENGHAFVCDGYDNSDNFHFNWGWSGYCDGYFVINDLTPAPGGIGGGNYDFSYSMHAVLGIEPTSGGGGGGSDPQASAFDLQLYNDFTVTPNPLQQGEDATIVATVANYGDTAFTGSVKLVLETANATEVQVIQQGTLNGSLAAGSGANMQLSGTITAPAGSYYLALYYKGTNESAWSYVGEDLGHDNPMAITVTAASAPDLQMYTNFSYTPNPLQQNTNATVSVSVINRGTANFSGSIKLVLENYSAQEQQVIKQKTISLNANSTDIYNLTGTITVPAGNYKMALYYKASSATTWTYVGTSYNTSLSNPKSVTVVSNVGINDHDVELTNIYPNPATDFITLQTNTANIEQVDIYNAAGQRVYTRKNVNSNEQINVSDWTAGIYFVRMITAEGTATRKFIVE